MTMTYSRFATGVVLLHCTRFSSVLGNSELELVGYMRFNLLFSNLLVSCIKSGLVPTLKKASDICKRHLNAF